MACCGGGKKKAVNTKSQSPSMPGLSSGKSANFQSYITSAEGQKFRVTGKKKTKR